MYIIKLKNGSIKEPKTVEEMKAHATGKYEKIDCFIGENYEDADSFVIRVSDPRKAAIFSTKKEATAYKNFLVETKIESDGIEILKMEIKLEKEKE